MTDHPASVGRRSRRVKTRRAWLLLVLGLIVPGSAQLAGGAKPLGRLGLRLWLTVLVVAALTALAVWLVPDRLVALLAHKLVLQIVAGLVLVVGVWALILLLNTWWIARPITLGALRGGVFTLVVAALATALVAGGYVGARYFVAGGQVLGSVLVGGGDTQVKEGRYNILLLGGDSGPDREGLRPDSVTVASVDAGTGRAVLFSLPRNLENVPFVAGSPLHKLFPDGFDQCAEENCLLNAVYLLGREHADLYPGAEDAGVEAMIDAVEGTLGLAINYYALVNMAGFAALIDAVHGIDITLSQPLDLGIMDDWNQEHVVTTVGPGLVHMDGETALLFARSRIQGNDFQRMARQKCVMAAMLNQLSPTTVATNFLSLADAAGNLLVTSVPPDQIAELGRLAVRARQLPIASVSFTPPLIAPGDADFGLIRQTVRDTVAAAEAADAAPAPASTTAAPPGPVPTTAAPEPGPTETSPGSMVDGQGPTPPPTQVDDLTAECAAG